MYERNAIIIDRYYNSMFGYDLKNNIKVNYTNYCELIDELEKYKNISEEEEEIIIEYDIIANRIRDIQKKQEAFNKKNMECQQERNSIFQNIDEDANIIQKSLDKVNKNILSLDEDIKENAQDFINIVAEFNEKTIVRTNCGKNRRMIEKQYNKILNETLDNYKNIDINLEKRAKQFIERDTSEIENELKKMISKNGEKEKIPFKEDAVEKAIQLSIDIQKRETDILSNIYEKTNKLFSEIKNNTIKIEKHKKLILDSNCKLDLIASIKEYMVQFLDNERLAAVNGENEYDKLMDEACHCLSEDLIQINNLYSLLIKEITKKATKKSYNDLYNIDYIEDLEKKEEEFENQVKKLKLPVAVLNPNHWRIDGMRRIYDVFNKCVIENYNKDLKKLIPLEDNNSEEDDNLEKKELIDGTNENNKIDVLHENKELDDEKFEQKNDADDDIKTEIDKKIDMILGIGDSKLNRNSQLDDEDWEEDDEVEDDEDWDDEDIFGQEEIDDKDDLVDEDVFDEDVFDEDIFDDDDWSEDEDTEQLDNEDDDSEKDVNNNDGDDDDDFDDEIDYDIWGNNITKKKKSHKLKEKEHVDDWENEFINIGKKDKAKKKGFFEKFMK